MILRWMFIDIGGPILDDGPLFRYLAEALRGFLREQGHPVTEEGFQTAKAWIPSRLSQGRNLSIVNRSSKRILLLDGSCT